MTDNNDSGKGVLYICPTPIGNLADMPERVIEILKEVDLVAAEDTRNTMKLFNHFEIKNKMVSYYEHNKVERGNYLIQLLLEGKNIAIVSDAGMPCISDPGEDIVRLAAAEDIMVTAIPGPSAFVCALAVSGLPTGRFTFEGFLPMNKRVRKERLEEIKNEVRTLIFYEAPHKLTYSLQDLYDALGDRRISIVREITKKFEEVRRVRLSEAVEYYKTNAPRGEFVLIIEGKDAEELKKEKEEAWVNFTIKEHVELHTRNGMSKNDAIKLVSKERGMKKNEVYKSVLED